MKAKFKDYSIQMQDSTGRVVTLYINGDSINELIAHGYPKNIAREMVETNDFENAVYRNEIGADAWII